MADEEEQDDGKDRDKEDGGDQDKDDGKKDEKKSGEKKDGDEEKPKRAPRWPFAVAALALVVFVGIVLAVELVPSADVWTDDAYVQVHYAMVSPRISGQVTAVFADDNDTVPASPTRKPRWRARRRCSRATRRSSPTRSPTWAASHR